MAAPKKKRVEPGELKSSENEDIDLENDYSNDENVDDDDQSNDDDDELIDQEVQVDFEARSPEGSDFHGIRRLLQQLFLKANINLGELADTIIEQNYVASVLKQIGIPEDDDDDDDDDDENQIFGVISAVNLSEKKNLECVKQIRTYLLDRCSQCSPDKKMQLEAVLDDANKHLGFLIHERFINLPPQVAVPSYETLRKEMERAVKKKVKFSFDNYLIISKLYKSKMQQPGKRKKGAIPESIIYANAEEEFFTEAASFYLDFCVADERDTAIGGRWDEEDEELSPWRRILVLPASKFDSVLAKIRETFGQ